MVKLNAVKLSAQPSDVTVPDQPPPAVTA